MTTRFHYDDAVYKGWLAERLPEKQQNEIGDHIERCENCQSKLESISQSDVDWQSVQAFLQPDELGTFEFKNETRRISKAFQGQGKEIPYNEVRDKEPRGIEHLDGYSPFLKSADNPNSIGKFGRYEVREVLGRGGMGVVIKGYDPALNREAAIKVLDPTMASNAVARKRFSREAKSAAAVIHKNVVPIQTVDEQDGLPYFVMPVINGKSLQERVRNQQGALNVAEILRIGSQTAAGLAAAHAQGLVHRDVKPANILLENGVERVLISDFGLARAADDANMTQSQVIAGTPQYMSPEQAQGHEMDCRSDLFSLGSVLYFMCCGHSPFRAKTTVGVLLRIIKDDPRPIRQLNSDIPSWLQSIINRLLSKDPNKRFQSAQEVSTLLESWLAHVNQPETVPAPAYPKTNSGSVGWPPALKWLAGAAAFAFFALAISIIVLETNKGTITIESVSDETKIHIKRGKTIVKELTVTNGIASTRIAAGEYEIEIEGEADEFDLENGTVKLMRGGKWFAKVVESKTGRKTDGRGKTEGREKAARRDKAGDEKAKRAISPRFARDKEALREAWQAFQDKDYDKALAGFEAIYEKDSKSESAELALHYLSSCYVNKNDLKRAIELEDQYIKEFPQGEYLASTKYFRGLNFYHLKEIDKAREAWKQTIQDHPDSREAGWIQELFSEVLDQKKKAKSENSKANAQPRINASVDERLEKYSPVSDIVAIAGYKFGKRKFDEAETLFKAALKREPEGEHASFALMHLAQCAAASGEYEVAIERVNDWLEQFPGNSAEAMQMSSLAGFYSQLKQDKKAIEWYEKLLEKYPNSAFSKSAKKQLESLRDE